MKQVSVHRRLSIKERGHLPNTLRLRPIEEISVFENGIRLIKGGGDIFIAWSEIKDAKVVSRKSVKGYGAAAGVDYTKKSFSFSANGVKYEFDISASFPDFQNSPELESALESNVNVRKIEGRSSNDWIYNVFYICLLFVLVYVFWDY